MNLQEKVLIIISRRNFLLVLLLIVITVLILLQFHTVPTSSSSLFLRQAQVTDKFNETEQVQVLIYYYFDPLTNYTRNLFTGQVTCPSERFVCRRYDAEDITILQNVSRYYAHSSAKHQITVGLYALHTLFTNSKGMAPRSCELPTDITIGETVESFTRYKRAYSKAQKNFDVISSTQPHSVAQQVYADAHLSKWHPLLETRRFSELIPAGVYVASDCHAAEPRAFRRDQVIVSIRNMGFRIDGLGKCLRSERLPETIQAIERNFKQQLQPNQSTFYRTKHQMLNHYAFYFAFENTIEEGYVTEKPFDGFVSGTVPVYIGATQQLKALLPHPKAAIFVDDFPSLEALVQYLQYLLRNQSAYEEHRQWRRTFDYEEFISDKPLLKYSWPCRMCEWATEQYWQAKREGRKLPLTKGSLLGCQIESFRNWYHSMRKSYQNLLSNFWMMRWS